MSRASRRLDALDKQAERKLRKLELKRATNPNRYKVDAKGYTARYFKKLSSAIKHYRKLKKANARPRMTSLIWGVSVWTSLQTYDLSARRRVAEVRKLAAPDYTNRVPMSPMIPKKKIEPFTPEQWNNTLIGVRTG